jgi:hypothetical protein
VPLAQRYELAHGTSHGVVKAQSTAGVGHDGPAYRPGRRLVANTDH